MSRDPFDLVRDWFAAFNRGDLPALRGFYADGAVVDADEGRLQGRDAIAAAWDARLSAWAPGFGGGIRRRLRMVGRVDTGVMRAEWVERESRDGGRQVRERTGVSDFELEGSRITHQREAAREGVRVTSAEGPLVHSGAVRPAGGGDGALRVGKVARDRVQALRLRRHREAGDLEYGIHEASYGWIAASMALIFELMKVSDAS